MHHIYSNLLERKLDTKLHHVWIDEENNLAIFPLFNLNGQLVGYQQYNPNADKLAKNNPKEGRYFTLLKDKKVGVWGLESWKLSNTLFITEGIFDACRITNLGYSAIALCSNDPSLQLKNWLYIIKQSRPVISICDNDIAGNKMKKLGHEFHQITEYKDLGEATDKYVTKIINKFTYGGNEFKNTI